MRSGNRFGAWLGLVLVAACAAAPATTAPSGPDRSIPPRAGPTAPPPGDDDAPVPSAPAGSTAAATAVGFSAAWVRGPADPAGWWSSLLPWCEYGLADALRSTDPANVPAHRLTGSPTQTGGSIEQGLTFEVPTDAGTLALTLAAIDGRWLVSEVDFLRSPA